MLVERRPCGPRPLEGCVRTLTGGAAPRYAAHRNITGDSRRYFAAVLKGEQTFAFEPALELSQNTQKSRIKTTVRE